MKAFGLSITVSTCRSILARPRLAEDAWLADISDDGFSRMAVASAGALTTLGQIDSMSAYDLPLVLHLPSRTFDLIEILRATLFAGAIQRVTY
jgi:hypothetical protein